jgi:hypothetical protein
MKHSADRGQRWLVLGLLCVVILLTYSSAWRKSPTFDEPYHVAVGYAAWTETVQRWDFIHPSLGRRWVSLPLLLLQPDIPDGVTNQGELAHQFVFHNKVSPETIFCWTRPMTLVPMLWLAWGVFLWSRQLFGARAGILSLLCIVLDPNMSAHSQLATNDIIMAATFFWATYLFWRLSLTHSFLLTIGAGVVTGLALTTKYSALVLLPALLILLIISHLKGNRRQQVPVILLALGLAAVFVFLEEGMELISLAEFTNEQLGLRAGALIDDWPVWATVRLPYMRYLYGVWTLFNSYAGGRPVFLLGELLSVGTPLYFPAVFLFKTSLSVLGLLIWRAATSLRSSARRGNTIQGKRQHDALFLILPPLSYVSVAMVGRLNLGYRHLLPMFPFLYVAIGQLGQVLGGRRGRLVMGGLLIGLALENLLTFPHYLAFFNLAVGGPSAGHRYLVDSNLDWGQELISLAEFQSAHQTGPVYLGYFGSADPAAYGVEYHCLPGLGYIECPESDLPANGWVAVSATCLQGLCTEEPDFYATLRGREPSAVLGYSMFLYHLP